MMMLTVFLPLGTDGFAEIPTARERPQGRRFRARCCQCQVIASVKRHGEHWNARCQPITIDIAINALPHSASALGRRVD